MANWLFVSPQHARLTWLTFGREADGELVERHADSALPSQAVSVSGRTRMLVAFSVTPLGVGEDVGVYVADAVRVVRESGLPNRTDAMFTTIEGEWTEVLDVVRRACEATQVRAQQDGASGRVSLVLKADIRPGVTGAMDTKVATVERYLAEPTV